MHCTPSPTVNVRMICPISGPVVESLSTFRLVGTGSGAFACFSCAFKASSGNKASKRRIGNMILILIGAGPCAGSVDKIGRLLEAKRTSKFIEHVLVGLLRDAQRAIVNIGARRDHALIRAAVMRIRR